MARSSVQRHWLAGQLERLDRLASETDSARAGADEHKRASRDAFLRAIDAFASEVASRPGVTACVVGHEGLVLAKAGAPPDAEILAAVSQVWLSAAVKGAGQLALGPMTQMVVVGEDHKVVLFQTGDMAIAILAPRESELARTMAG